jgi:hypothetical protein
MVLLADVPEGSPSKSMLVVTPGTASDRTIALVDTVSTTGGKVPVGGHD